VPVGEQLRVTTQITNTGSQQTEATIQLTTTAGTATDTDTQSLTLAPGDSTTQTLTIETTGVQPGTYTATVSVIATPSGSGGDDQTETVNSTSTEFAVSPLKTVAGEFDADGDGEIRVPDLARAGRAFARDDLGPRGLAAVGRAFARSQS